ncbi:class II fructose-bisphosphate aldolase [bacterium]|nr:class II fructose-bisphosphate aldolase [bacterium]MBU1599573.1 class II fructose-bisphosphate aldolase [bacterium]MBU2462172.1 class II fructose-bisphosphate aldolase [bacterium]
MVYSKDSLLNDLSKSVEIGEVGVSVRNRERVKGELIDRLIYNACLNPDEEIRDAVRWLIREMARDLGIFPASIFAYYSKMPENISVPAINIRGLTYDVARAIFSQAMAGNIGACIFEIARSEMEYTYQEPAEYSTLIMAAGIKEGFTGPVFIQGDHFQIRKKIENDIENVKLLIKKAVEAGFYNLDLDTSTLVDLNQPTVYEQQRKNFETAAELTRYIRSIEPEGVTVSLGGEIGEIGKQNSTEEELREYLKGYRESLGKELVGISKMAIQTGTAHGGIVLPDGSIAEVKLDFDTLSRLGKITRDDYNLAGCVQHGASTLPLELFDKFPASYTIEVHLATEYQNITYELIPEGLKEEIYAYLREHCLAEKKETDTDEQFIYKTRKKGFGPFKEKFWGLSEEIKAEIRDRLAEKFTFAFDKLGVKNTQEAISQLVKPVYQQKPIPGLLKL